MTSLLVVIIVLLFSIAIAPSTPRYRGVGPTNNVISRVGEYSITLDPPNHPVIFPRETRISSPPMIPSGRRRRGEGRLNEGNARQDEIEVGARDRFPMNFAARTSGFCTGIARNTAKSISFFLSSKITHARMNPTRARALRRKFVSRSLGSPQN